MDEEAFEAISRTLESEYPEHFDHIDRFRKAGIRASEGPSTCLACHRTARCFRRAAVSATLAASARRRAVLAALSITTPTAEICLRCHQHNFGGDIYVDELDAFFMQSQGNLSDARPRVMHPGSKRKPSKLYAVKRFNVRQHIDLANISPFGGMYVPYDLPTYSTSGDPDRAVAREMEKSMMGMMYGTMFKVYLLDRFMSFIDARHWGQRHWGQAQIVICACPQCGCPVRGVTEG